MLKKWWDWFAGEWNLLIATYFMWRFERMVVKAGLLPPRSKGGKGKW